MSRSDRNDLTQGVIWKKLVLYFLPIVAGSLLQQLYNAADAIIVSKYVGTEALAAVGGSPATLINLLLGFFIALSGGAGVVIAQHFGAKNGKMVDKDIHTSISFCFIVGVVMGFLVTLLAPFILRLMKTPADTFDGAVIYTQIYFSGCVFVLLYNMGSGILRALGDSKSPSVYLAVSCITNIALDLFFVKTLNMGVAGAAVATVIAQAISAVCILIKLLFAKEHRLEMKKLGIDTVVLGNMLRIGVPAGAQSAMYGLSNMILQVAVNSLGTVVVASWSMSGKIDGVYWASSAAFGTALTNFVGQNYGAGLFDRVKKSVKSSFAIFCSLTVTLSSVIIIFAKQLLRIFTNDTAVVDTTYWIILFFVPFYILWTLIEIFSGALRGVGDAVKPVIIIALGVCLLRVVWVLTVFRVWSTLLSVSICYPVSWAVTVAALFVYYFRHSRFAELKKANIALDKKDGIV